MAGLATKVGALFFALFAIVHIVRIAQGWDVTIGGHSIPMTASYVAVAFSAAMAFLLWKAGAKKKE